MYYYQDPVHYQKFEIAVPFLGIQNTFYKRSKTHIKYHKLITIADKRLNMMLTVFSNKISHFGIIHQHELHPLLRIQWGVTFQDSKVRSVLRIHKQLSPNIEQLWRFCREYTRIIILARHIDLLNNNVICMYLLIIQNVECCIESHLYFQHSDSLLQVWQGHSLTPANTGIIFV